VLKSNFENFNFLILNYFFIILKYFNVLILKKLKKLFFNKKHFEKRLLGLNITKIKG